MDTFKLFKVIISKKSQITNPCSKIGRIRAQYNDFSDFSNLESLNKCLINRKTLNPSLEIITMCGLELVDLKPKLNISSITYKIFKQIYYYPIILEN